MTGLSSQPLWAQGFIFKASLLPWCTALSPMPSAWPASTASSAGKPLPAQPSRTHRQVPHRATLPPSAPRSHHFLLRCPQTMPPALMLVQFAKPSTTSVPTVAVRVANALSQTCWCPRTPLLYPSAGAGTSVLRPTTLP